MTSALALSSALTTGHAGSVINRAVTELGPATPAPSKLTPAFTAPGCSGSSCPMGVNDYGITPTGTTYTYTATQVESFADVSSVYVSGTTHGCLDPHAKWCMGFQSNWVDSNVMVHNHYGVYWIQNIAQVAYDPSCSAPCVSKTFSVSWLDNIWNLSAPGGCKTSTGFECMNPGDLLGNLTGLCSAHGFSSRHNFYSCQGPKDYGLTFPFTIWALMITGKSSSIIGNFPYVDFYGGIVQNNKLIAGATYDQVGFIAGSATFSTPLIQVASTPTPSGLAYDGEWDICGFAGGAKVTLSKANVMMESYHKASGVWVSIPHAWSSGTDTAQSVTNANLYSFLAYRDTGSATVGTENPQTSLW